MGLVVCRLPMLSMGVDRVVEQVVSPKIYKDFKPQIDRVICEILDIDYDEWLARQSKDKKQLNYLQRNYCCSDIQELNQFFCYSAHTFETVGVDIFMNLRGRSVVIPFYVLLQHMCFGLHNSLFLILLILAL
jgi:hypothetical protein